MRVIAWLAVVAAAIAFGKAIAPIPPLVGVTMLVVGAGLTIHGLRRMPG